MWVIKENSYKNITFVLCIVPEIFTQALGLSEPWYVSKVEFIAGKHSNKELHIWLSFNRGARFRVTGGLKLDYPHNSV